MNSKCGSIDKNKKLLYRNKLTATEHKRYQDKLAFIDGKDPLDPAEIKSWTRQCEEILPAVSYFDIVNYLVYTTSTYTQEQFKCYKGLDAYNQFVSGWVSDRAAYVCRDNKHIVVSGKVLHSQRLREKALRPWIVAEKEGVIVFGHCDCQAGCGEVCTHIAALLFSVDAVVRIRDARTVTEKAAYWKLPSELKQIEYSKLADIDFTSAKTLKRKLDKKIDSQAQKADADSKKTQVLVPVVKDIPSDAELDSFYQELFETDTKPVVLSTVEPYSDAHVPCVVSQIFPQLLSDLYDEKQLTSSYEDLIAKCKSVSSVQVTEQQAKEVETATHLQYKTKIWNRFRTGRITASRAKAVCSTDPINPAISLIKAICYPEENKFSTPATKWGCDHEEIAKSEFIRHMEPFHEDLRVEQCGFFIDPKHPHLGASPDGIVSCKCCGTSLLEIKCPYCKNRKLSESSFKFLLKKEDGRMKLDKRHSYYYQIQTQLGVTGKDVCFFVVWTSEDLHVERIAFDEELFDDICKKSKQIFETAVLPELVGKFFSRRAKLPESESRDVPSVPKKQQCVVSGDRSPLQKRTIPSTSTASCPPRTSGTSSVLTVKCLQNTENNTQKTEAAELWCFCREEEYGDMIFCESENCSIQWFHFQCVGIEKQPKGSWFCDDCRPFKQSCKKARKK